MTSTSHHSAETRFHGTAEDDDTGSVNAEIGVDQDAVAVLKDRIATLEKEISLLSLENGERASASHGFGGSRLLLAAIFHEMRGPLQGVIARTRLLERRAGSRAVKDEAKAIRDEVWMAMAQAQRTAEIMGGGDLSACASEGVVAMSPATLLGEVARMLAPRLRCGNRVRVDPHTSAAEVMLEPTGITQILSIAVDNADRHTRDDTILLRAVLDPQRGILTFLVEDHGTGIAAHELPYVFDPFMSGADPTTEHTSGFGLGLSIARRAALALDGTVALDSVEGRGTTLRLEVPWREARKERVAVLPRKATDERLLLVDDDDGMARLMTQILGLGGYSVVRARNGEEAFCLLREERFHRVVSDHRMPGGSGLELMLRWPEIRDPQTPMLILSGQVPPDALAQYEARGIKVAIKPVDTPLLYRLLSESQAPR
jgi:signal transduction histidine kinase/CheY-like chemotaxis protein